MVVLDRGGGGGGLVAKLCLSLCNPTDCSLLGSSVHGISQARILVWVAISFSRGSSQPRDRMWVSCLAGKFFTTEPPGKPKEVIKSAQSDWCPYKTREFQSPERHQGRADTEQSCVDAVCKSGRGLRGSHTRRHLDLQPPPCRTVRNTFLLLKPASLGILL